MIIFQISLLSFEKVKFRNRNVNFLFWVSISFIYYAKDYM